MPVISKPNQQRVRKLILDSWLNEGGGPVTRKILRKVEHELKESGVGLPVSPASIAQVLAGAGAELRHPDLIEADAAWREAQLKSAKAEGTDNPLTLQRAAVFIKKLESLRQRLATDFDRLRQLREAALNEKAKAQL